MRSVQGTYPIGNDSPFAVGLDFLIRWEVRIIWRNPGSFLRRGKIVGFIFIDHKKIFSSVKKGIPNILCIMYNQKQRWTMDIVKNIDAKNNNVKNNFLRTGEISVAFSY